MKIKKLFLSSLFLLSAHAQGAFELDLVDLSSNFLTQSQRSISSHYECFERSKKLYLKLFHTPIHAVNLYQYGDKDLAKVVQNSFQTRLNIRQHLSRYKKGKLFAQECLSSVRDATRALRYLEDYVVAHLSAHDPRPYVTLKGKGAYFNIADKSFRSYKDLQSGDIILSRGGAYTSAAIARIGVSDAQFSHMSFVYRDERGKLHTTEAHIELGSVVAPIQKHIDQKNIRSVVYRFQDQALAHKAAKYMYEKVKRHSANFKDNIFYDFGMNYQDNSKLFCSEVVYDGFNQMSKGLVKVPLYLSKFPAKLIPFLNQIGIKVNLQNINTFETFAPSDIEFDPRFKVVAEWRRPDKLHDSLIKDAVLTKIFEWMGQGLKLRPTLGIKLKTLVAWTGRRLPWIQNALREKLPLNMQQTQLKVFMTMDLVGEAIQERLELQQHRLGRKMSFKEMFQFLDELKRHDEISYYRSKPTVFHQYFRR